MSETLEVIENHIRGRPLDRTDAIGLRGLDAKEAVRPDASGQGLIEYGNVEPARNG